MIYNLDFDCLIGATIKYCQCIENDIKIIYSEMLEGDFESNYQIIKKDTLGTIVDRLQNLDESDNKPYFSKDDYQILRTITKVRNYWVHQGYLDYVYNPSNFPAQYQKLYTDSQKLVKLHQEIEDVKLEFLKQ